MAKKKHFAWLSEPEKKHWQKCKVISLAKSKAMPVQLDRVFTLDN
jgi:hypothetical protein